MQYAVIMAGGTGTRLWPMSRGTLPKQLIPFLGGKSLLRLAYERLEGLIAPERRFICAGQKHRAAVLAALSELDAQRFLGEPEGRDTLNAVGLTAAVLAAQDPAAVFAVLTADQLIEPVVQFRQIVGEGFALVEREPNTLVTFGIAPTHPATGYGYLQLGAPIDRSARIVEQFREKPPLATAEQYVQAGSDRYLWNSGMFVWRAATLLDCIRRYEPSVWEGLNTIAAAWDTPDRDSTLGRIFPTLKKTSVDFAVMEPASRDPAVRVAAIPMPLRWLDVGSWPAFAETCPQDAAGNALAAARSLLLDSTRCLVASDRPDHLVALVGCDNLVVVHTANATLVCSAEMAEKIKDIQKLAQQQFGSEYT